ncbi:hypothetical protein SLS62_004460 [Diatrype stigma]|uniref:Formin GTPase-binding domain-containing protein n=1 Tax=Diatrype stigma TaxID=117547 RepID=A0AAN9YT50_9PEZI
MASTENSYPSRPLHHQRSKSNVLKSFMHRRDDSDASVIQPTEIYNTSNSNYEPSTRPDMRFPNFSRNNALGEIQQNQMDIASRSPRKTSDPPPSPTKTGTFASMKSKMSKEKSNTEKSDQQLEPPDSPTKPKKTKSATNLAGLFSKPKSLKGMYRFGGEDEMRPRKDKENRTPPSSLGTPQEIARPPIYAQFASGALEKMGGPTSNSNDIFSSRHSGGHRSSNGSGSDMSSGYKAKPRPQSYHVAYTSKPENSSRQASDHRSGSGSASPSKISRGLHIFTGGPAGPKSSQSSQSSEPAVDPKDIDKHLEAMLDRRNIPEHQRYKMRNLADTIKMEFIRQDYAESRGLAHYRPGSHDSDLSMTSGGPGASSNSSNNNNNNNNNTNNNNNSGGAGAGGKVAKKSRTRSFTLSRGKKSEPNSPTKKQKGEGSLGRHFRSKSTESVTSTNGGEQSSSIGGGGSSGQGGGGILSKIKLQQGPVDYVNYLRKVQKPELVEVGKLHKLRLLLRNETVAWTEEFIRQGGMQEIVGLLHRIMDVEWREEHEDALLHENLLCLKALCTTALALQYLHSIQGTLFPALLRMLFDPEKKGPSEFTTRGIITSVLFTYIQSAPAQDRPIRARTVLAHLRDPEPKDEDRPLGFVLEMRRDRPYRVWCKEAVGVTKEVFWIFLHHLNVVYLPRNKDLEQKKQQQQQQNQRRISSFSSAFDDDDDNNVSVHEDQNQGQKNSSSSSSAAASDAMDDAAYMRLHFPQERPPVPAAPYVGGVEWDATNYLASHLDLLNAILACTAGGRAERNALREALRISGWERCMGGSLRLCKEKFYPGVHDALRTWVAAAADDGWAVRDVRYGPPPAESAASRGVSPAKKNNGGGGGNNNNNGGIKLNNNNRRDDLLPPRLEMPRLSLGLDTAPSVVPTSITHSPRVNNNNNNNNNNNDWLS